MTFTRVCLVSSVLLFTMACGGRSNSTSPSPSPSPQPQAPIITIQPTSQGVALGQAVTFSVVASGTEPIRYQWNWNGSPIVGATNTSFTPTSATIPADNGSVFTVTVANSVGSLASNGAVLTVSPAPRSPKIGDLRFKDVDAVPFGLQGIEHLTFPTNLLASWHNALGTPLDIGGNGPTIPDGNPMECDWGVGVSYLPLGMPDRDFACRGGFLTGLEADFDTLGTPNTVITSLDIENGQGAYAATWVTTSQQGIYSGVRQTVQPSAIQAAATQAGAQGYVITAISFNAGQVYFISYGWNMDPSTIYDVKVSSATASTIGAAATSLGSEGYIITAVGGNYTDGFLLVGTRVQGDSMPRPILVNNTASSGRGYAPIVSVLNATGSDPTAWTTIWIAEQ